MSIIHKPNRSASSSITSRPIPPARSTRPSRHLLRRLEFHDTPKHASWLNMVEIEIGVLRGQCLDRRIGERDRLVAEIAAWERQRNASRARVKWMFTTERPRQTRPCLPRHRQRVVIPVQRY